jgi:hypothetical protein
LILIISAIIITSEKTYFTALPCAQLAWDMNGSEQKTLQYYPECASYFDESNPNQHAVVHANFQGRYEEVGASMEMSFGMATWLALALHAIGIEIYVRVCLHCFNQLLTTNY